MSGAHLNPAVRHEAVIAIDVTDANPNGDPDGQGEPRTDDETGHGLISDVSLKRKIRDTVAELHGAEPHNQIFVEAGTALSPRAEEGWQHTGDDDAEALAWLCGRYFDVRMFGAVLTRGKGQAAASVRGPVQMSFARSVDPVFPVDHGITRITQSRQVDLDRGQTTEYGRKPLVLYGLYVAHLYYSAPRGVATGITSDDLATLWRAVLMMCDLTRAANRGRVDVAGLWVFSHPDRYGVAPARRLLDSIALRTTVDPPRHWSHYQRHLPAELPAGITLTTLHDLWESP